MTMVDTLCGGICSRESAALSSRIDWPRRHKFETNLRGKRLVDGDGEGAEEWSATIDKRSGP
jgi:hypothetical protein